MIGDIEKMDFELRQLDISNIDRIKNFFADVFRNELPPPAKGSMYVEIFLGNNSLN